MIREFEIKYAILFLYIYHQANLLKKFETFADNLELNLHTTAKKKKKNLIVLLGDLTAKNVNSTKMIARLMKILKLTTLHCNLECNS